MNKFSYKNRFSKKTSVICLVLTMLIAGTYCAIVSNQTMPYAEGWYSYYAKIINNGEVPYRDFEFLFWPFYLNFIAFITKIFGYKIIVLRIMGIIFFIILSGLAYKILCKLFSPINSMIGAVVAVLYLQSEIVQIFYDYVRLMDIFAYLSVLFLIYIWESFYTINYKKFNIFSMLLGLSVSGFVLTKQNMGLLFWVFVICLYLFFAFYWERCREVLRGMLVFIVTSLSSTILLLIVSVGISNFDIFFSETLGGASEAKGGIFAILFNWIIKGGDSFKAGVPLFFIVTFFMIINILLSKKAGADLLYEKSNILCGIIFVICTGGGIFIMAKNSAFAYSFANLAKVNPYSIYLLSVLLFLVLFLFFCKKRSDKQLGNDLFLIKVFVICGAFFAIGYGCGTSGGISQGQMGLPLGFFVALLLHGINHRFSLVLKGAVVISTIVICLTSAAYKYAYTYNWWGMTEPTIWESSEETDLELLDGILVSENTKYIYENITDIIKKYTDKSDSIFAFPHIPIFYLLADRPDPNTYSKVQWFDVATDSTVLNDISKIEMANPAALIIYDIPEYAKSAHETSFRKGETSAYRVMQTSLEKYANSEGYIECGRYAVNEDNTITLYGRPDLFKGEVKTINNLEVTIDGKTYSGKYKGEVINGLANGQGEFECNDGTINIESNWNGGELDGSAKILFEDGTFMEKEFSRGIPKGVIRSYSSEGTLTNIDRYFDTRTINEIQKNVEEIPYYELSSISGTSREIPINFTGTIIKKIEYDTYVEILVQDRDGQNYQGTYNNTRETENAQAFVPNLEMGDNVECLGFFQYSYDTQLDTIGEKIPHVQLIYSMLENDDPISVYTRELSYSHLLRYPYSFVDQNVTLEGTVQNVEVNKNVKIGVASFSVVSNKETYYCELSYADLEQVPKVKSNIKLSGTLQGNYKEKIFNGYNLLPLIEVDTKSIILN